MTKEMYFIQWNCKKEKIASITLTQTYFNVTLQTIIKSEAGLIILKLKILKLLVGHEEQVSNTTTILCVTSTKCSKKDLNPLYSGK